MGLQPRLGLLALVRGEVVHDRDDLTARGRRDRVIDLLQEADQILAVTSRAGHRMCLTGMHAQRGEQVHRAVPGVLVVAARGLARRWQRVRSREAPGLNARLLIDREHQRVRWRVEVQAAHLATALLEVRLIEIGHHPVLGPVRTNLRPAQDHVRLRLRDPDLLTQLAMRPTLPALPRLGLRWTGARLRDQQRPLLRTVRQRAPRPRPIPQPLHSQLRITPPPLLHRPLRAPDTLSDLRRRQPRTRCQHDPRPLNHPHLTAHRTRDPLKLHPLLTADLDPPARTLHSHHHPPSSPNMSTRTSGPPAGHPHTGTNLQEPPLGCCQWIAWPNGGGLWSLHSTTGRRRDSRSPRSPGGSAGRQRPSRPTSTTRPARRPGPSRRATWDCAAAAALTPSRATARATRTRTARRATPARSRPAGRPSGCATLCATGAPAMAGCRRRMTGRARTHADAVARRSSD